MSDQSADRRRALAFNAVGPAINSRGYWLPLSARRAVADAVLEAVAGEHDADQRRAVRIQTLLDDTRDRIRKLHRPVERAGRVVCAECSAHDGHSSTDSPPVDHPCLTITALEPTA